MKKINYLYLGLLVSQVAIAQVGINKEVPRATMDIASKNGTVADGLLIPRMTADELQAMTESTSPQKVGEDQNSLLVYITKTFTTPPTTNVVKYELVTSTGFYYYDSKDNGGNGKWKKLQDTPGGGGNVYLPGPGITFTGTSHNKITSSGLERVTVTTDKIGGADIQPQTNTGWRYVGMNEVNYGPTGKWATDLQYIPNSDDENKIAFHYISMEAISDPSIGDIPAMAESKTYTQLKQEIEDKYGSGTSRANFDYSKVGAIGDHAFAVGGYNIVGAPMGAAFGYGNRNYGISSFVSGQFNDVKGDRSFVAGENNTLDFEAKGSFVMGVDNTLNSSSNTAIGKSNKLGVAAGKSFALGEGNNIESVSAIALGTNNVTTGPSGSKSILIGDQCKANSAENSILIGQLCTASATGCILIGTNNRTHSNSNTNGVAIGHNNEVQYQNTYLIGNTLRSNKEYQFVCGRGNELDSEAAFILGGGTIGNLLVVKNATGKEGDLHAKGRVYAGGEIHSVGNVYAGGEIHSKGDIYAGGAGNWKKVRAAQLQQMSDIRLKKDIENLPVNSDVLSQLRPVQYHWKEGDSNTLQYGFIAQEIEEIFPNLVDTDTQGEKYKSVNYVGLIPVLTKVLQEKSVEIASQKEEIASLKAQLQAEKERNDAQEARLKAIEEQLIK